MQLDSVFLYIIAILNSLKGVITPTFIFSLQDLSSFDGCLDHGDPADAAALAAELERLRREKRSAFAQLERYKKIITYACILAFFSLLLAAAMVTWRLTPDPPEFDELRLRVLDTHWEPQRHSDKCAGGCDEVEVLSDSPLTTNPSRS